MRKTHGEFPMPIPLTGAIDTQEVNREIGSDLNALFDVNTPLPRLLAGKLTGPVRWSDFRGKSLKRHYGLTRGFNSCSTRTGNFIKLSTIFPGIAVGWKFRVVLGMEGSWAPYAAVMEYWFTYGTAAAYSADGNPGGGKSIIQGAHYDGGDTFFQEGYYAGRSTKFPCSTQYLMTIQLLGTNAGLPGSGSNNLYPVYGTAANYAASFPAS